jgi:zinc transport system substrate-binding protein
MKPLRFAVLSLFMAASTVTGCRRADDVWPSTGAKRVLVSFPPLYCFAKNVAGKDVDVRCLLTAQGPHEFIKSANANETETVRKADLILANGLGLDEWIYRMLKNGKGNVVEVAEGIPQSLLKPSVEGESHGDDGHGHKHGSEDPHVWLGPPQAKAMVDVIVAKLAELDPKNKARYGERAETYKKELDDLQAYGKAKFGNKKSRNIIATHDSLQYFADAFGLKVVGSIQPRPGIEADSKKLTELVKLCKEYDVSVIAVEPQYFKGTAEALRNQLSKQGVTVALVEVDPLETAPAAPINPDPAYYTKQMYRNIDNIAKALP